MNIRPMGAKLFHANGRTDKTKLTNAFRNSANAPENETQNRHKVFTTFKWLRMWSSDEPSNMATKIQILQMAKNFR